MIRCFLLLALWALRPPTSYAQIAQAAAFRQQADALYSAGKYDQATSCYEKAYRLVRDADPLQAASLCVDLSRMDYMAGHNQLAVNRGQMGLRHLSTTTSPPDSATFKLFSSLGTFYKALSRNDSVLLYFRKTDALLAHNPLIGQQILPYVLAHYKNQGDWFFKAGNYTKSLVCLTKAREIAEISGNTDDQSYIESNLAGCYDAQAQFDDALKHRLSGARLYHKKDIRTCQLLSNIGWTLHQLHRYPAALRYFAQADRLLNRLRRGNQSANYITHQIQLWRMLGTCHRSAGHLPEADHYLTQALQLHHRYLGTQGALLAQVYTERGRFYEARHNLKPALAAYQAAIRAECHNAIQCSTGSVNPTVAMISDESTLLLATWRKAAVLKKLYDATQQADYLTAAVDAYQLSVGVQQRIRHGIDTDQAQVAFTARQHRLIPESVGVAFTAYQHQASTARREDLFQLFEQARAGSLNEALRLTAIRPQTLPVPLLEQEQTLKNQISELRKRPAGDTTASAELTARQLQWHQLMDTFRQDFPAYYQLNYRKTAMSSQRLQHKLDDQTAYIAYVRHQTSLFILVATRQTVAIIRHPIDSVRFDGQLAALRQQLYHDPVLTRYAGMASSADLYAACIAPIRSYLTGKSRLVIARDWSFNFLPFEVLETGRQAGNYLTHQYAISYAFSAQLFFDRFPLSASTESALVVVPFVPDGATTLAVNRQKSFWSLPASEAEARHIGGDVLLGSQASLSNFLKTNLARPVIYLATHAETDDADPANSFIAFYPGEADKLYTEGIYNLNLSTTGLIVLGACETGSGKISQGEGVLSLARAFAYAGCPAVVTTLWQANDETTSFLTIRLHHYLTQGLTTDRALQQARQDFFASALFPKYNHPYYWANYTLLGNPAPVMPGKASPAAAGMMAIVGLLGLGAFWQRNRLSRFMKRSRQMV